MRISSITGRRTTHAVIGQMCPRDRGKPSLLMALPWPSREINPHWYRVQDIYCPRFLTQLVPFFWSFLATADRLLHSTKHALGPHPGRPDRICRNFTITRPKRTGYKVSQRQRCCSGARKRRRYSRRVCRLPDKAVLMVLPELGRFDRVNR